MKAGGNFVGRRLGEVSTLSGNIWLVSEGVAPFCDPSGDNDWLNAYEELLKPTSACWRYASFRVRGHHWGFCEGRGIEGVKAVSKGSGGKPSSQNLPPCTAKRLQTWMLVVDTGQSGDGDFQYLFHKSPLNNVNVCSIGKSRNHTWLDPWLGCIRRGQDCASSIFELFMPPSRLKSGIVDPNSFKLPASHYSCYSFLIFQFLVSRSQPFTDKRKYTDNAPNWLWWEVKTSWSNSSLE